MAWEFKTQVRGKKTPLMELGAKAYAIRVGGPSFAREERIFRCPCPMCLDEKEIMVNGIVAKCPYCNSSDRKDQTRISVQHYIVEEFIVNEICFQSETYKNGYSKAGPLPGHEPKVSRISGFSKIGNGYSDVSTRALPTEPYLYDKKPEDILGERKSQFFNEDNYVWTSRKAAEEICYQLNRKEADALAEFNAQHGTKHEYPWPIDGSVGKR